MKETSFHEVKTHGTLSFPYAVYRVMIPAFFHSFPLHWHNEMELIYVKSGRGIVTVQSNRYEVNEGDITVILPQTVHAIDRSDESEMEYYNILFDFSLLNCSANDACYEKYFAPLYTHTLLPPTEARRGDEFNRALLANIEYLIGNRHNIANDELMIKANLFEIMDTINRFAAPASSSDISLKNNYEKLKNLLVHIRSDYSRDIDIKEAADICGYSPSHFMKLFKELTGKSFTHYLINYRLEIAARQLADARTPITDIAASVGFNNNSYFSRAFCAKYGKTPSEYRKSVTETNSPD